jgi:putative two-component system response regulator
MIVDDNADNCLLFGRIVSGLASVREVVAHEDPREALDACRQSLPDLVVLDYMMPGLNGHEVLSALRDLPGGRGVPVVMITGAGDSTVRQRALELGATDFLSKPVEPTEMRVRLANLLALRYSQLRLERRNRSLAEEVERATRSILDREQELIVRLARAAEFRDPGTGEHIQRMAYYSRRIAEGLGLPRERCELIQRAAPMHDIGKLGIPDGILLKPGPLTAEEWSVMKRHSAIGHEILRNSPAAPIQMGAEIALAHHERFDGTGYPRGLVGVAIPLPARIVSVSDTFDALTSVRPYKTAWPPEQAREHLLAVRGRHLDPDCVDVFLAAWDDLLAIRARFVDPPSTPAALVDADIAGVV